MNQNRLKTITITIVFFYTIIICRLFYWQIIKYESYSQKIINQTYKPSEILPETGIIYDNQNNPLVLNITLYHLSLYKPDIKINVETITDTIKKAKPDLLVEDEILISKFIANNNQKWLVLKDNFDKTMVSQLNITGFTFTQFTKRYYPEDPLGQLFLKPDTGLEGYYRQQISGRSGFIYEAKDATGQTVLTKSSWSIDPINGRNLYTSINRQIQDKIESSLKDGISKYSADSGSITIMSPDGAIVAMASFTASDSGKLNPIISDLYEPGSIFKPLVMSMAFDTSTINENYICDKCYQPHQIGKYSISNWDSSFHPNSNLKDIIKNSDNIGMSYIIQKLGQENFLKYFQKLGLDRKTGIDIQGEIRPIIKTYWPEIDLATASFGQGFAITQIQMLTAFNAIANNGLMTTPHFVNYFEEDSKLIPNLVNPPISIFKQSTIDKMKSILKYSVENGVVAKFKPESIEVCAKSGTSQIAVQGGYSDSSTIASYIGFSPCQNPKFTMIVTINNPRTSPWGSSTAAPIWFEIATFLDSMI